MKILHTSDWHLGMTFNGINIMQDQIFFIDQICKIIDKEEVDAVIIAGDVFDKSVASSQALELYDQAVTKICGELKVPVFVVAGNHDGSSRLASCGKLLEKAGLYIKGRLEKNIRPVSFLDTDIYMLPWFTLEKVKSLYPDECDKLLTLEDGYELVCSKIRDNMDRNKKNILISHAFIIKAETSGSDRAAQVGLATAVGSGVFREFDYVALGHIHKAQDISESIRYSGTPMIYSFGTEEKQEKSVTIIDTEDLSKSIIPIEALHDRLTISGTYEDILNEREYSTREQNAYLRVEIEDAVMGLELLARLREKFPNLLEASGKSFEVEGATQTMTIEELESNELNPMEIFIRYCQDNMKESPDEHLKELFEEALEEIVIL